MKLTWIIFYSVFVFLSQSSSDNLFQGTGEISFISSAPLETITASSEKLKGIIDLSSHSFAFTFPVTSFDGFNSQLQREHFNENYMESSKYPNATFAGNILDFDHCDTKCEMKILAKGKLTIHGVTKVVTLPVMIKRDVDALSATSEFNIQLSDFNIDIPLILEGKISPLINITVSANFTKKN